MPVPIQGRGQVEVIGAVCFHSHGSSRWSASKWKRWEASEALFLLPGLETSLFSSQGRPIPLIDILYIIHIAIATHCTYGYIYVHTQFLSLYIITQVDWWELPFHEWRFHECQFHKHPQSFDYHMNEAETMSITAPLYNFNDLCGPLGQILADNGP